MAITACASIVGRLFLGTFVDRCDKRYVTMVCVLIQGLAVLTLAFYSHVVLLYLCTFAFGLTMGSLIMMQSLLIGECFGIPSFATVSGAIGLVLYARRGFRADDCGGDIRRDPELPGVVYPVCGGEFYCHGGYIFCQTTSHGGFIKIYDRW